MPSTYVKRPGLARLYGQKDLWLPGAEGKGECLRVGAEVLRVGAEVLQG